MNKEISKYSDFPENFALENVGRERLKKIKVVAVEDVETLIAEACKRQREICSTWLWNPKRIKSNMTTVGWSLEYRNRGQLWIRDTIKNAPKPEDT